MVKFVIAHVISMLWLAFSIYLSKKWIVELAEIISFPLALLSITGIAYIPGYLNAFMVCSLLLDRQPKFKVERPDIPVTVLIAAWNEEKGITDTLAQIAKQEYAGKIHVIVIDNNSKDCTSAMGRIFGSLLGLNITVVNERRPGKNYALNTGLKYVKTDWVLTLDADTLLHKDAINNIVARMVSAPPDVCAVAGAVLVRNSRGTLLGKIQEWDYFLAIASVKRLQGMYQQTLVAQGAFSLYKTEVVKEMGGWPDVIGEDIVLTWKFLKQGYKVFFEPTAVSFTTVPTSLVHFIRQRSRWARGMIEGLKAVKPWEQPHIAGKYLTGVNLVMPLIDFTYTFCWIPGVFLAFCGKYWIVGPLSLLVLPITFLSYYILFTYQKSVFRKLGLRVRKNLFGLVLFTLGYQIIMSPVSVWGYLQEVLNLRRVWK
ncbi:glycosyltransferase [Brevibacillus sp. B_LB10_24]|uniref:glycosyltransferase n=1 Tax=Brevibacillus sp. B_LB10_24 TaxID=3380645 RepID=UPI0038B77933